MHPRLVAVYMTALAQSMAAEWGAVALTDDVVDHAAITGLDVTRDRLRHCSQSARRK
jgi:hypothetical protein